jgi:hypothetical protein
VLELLHILKMFVESGHFIIRLVAQLRDVDIYALVFISLVSENSLITLKGFYMLFFLVLELSPNFKILQTLQNQILLKYDEN